MNCSWKGVRMQRGDDACCLSGLFFENIYCCSTVQFRKPPLYICRISLGPTEKFLEIPFASVGFSVFLRCNPANLRFIIRRISLGLTEKFLEILFYIRRTPQYSTEKLRNPSLCIRTIRLSKNNSSILPLSKRSGKDERWIWKLDERVFEETAVPSVYLLFLEL